jgi:hypothetical protein
MVDLSEISRLSALARFAFPDRWKRLSLIMVLTMAVDVDHFLANPSLIPSDVV